MAIFPVLSSGAVCQYPVQIAYQQPVQVLRYLDGSSQRFLRRDRQLRKWEIRLDLLSEREMAGIETFFQSQMGDYSPFDFVDPFSDAVVPHCVFGAPTFTGDSISVGVGSTSIWIVETNG